MYGETIRAVRLFEMSYRYSILGTKSHTGNKELARALFGDEPLPRNSSSYDSQSDGT